MHKHVRIQKSNLISTSRKRGKKTNSQFPPTGIERPEQIKAKLSLKSYKTAACPPLACPSQLTVPVTKASVPRAFLHACVHAWLRWWWVENCAVARTSPPLEIHPGVTRLFVSTIKKKRKKKREGGDARRRDNNSQSMFPVGARIADRHPCLSAKNLELCAYTWRSAAASCVTKSIPIRFSLRSFLSFPPPDFRMEMEKFLLSSGRSYKMDKIFSYRD